jgi:hypothetical protein
MIQKVRRHSRFGCFYAVRFGTISHVGHDLFHLSLTVLFTIAERDLLSLQSGTLVFGRLSYWSSRKMLRDYHPLRRRIPALFFIARLGLVRFRSRYFRSLG